MCENKDIIFIISELAGGGAEHVVFRLSDEMVNMGYRVTIISVNTLKNANLYGMNPQIDTFSLADNIVNVKTPKFNKIAGSLSRYICKSFECINRRPPMFLAEKSFLAIYGTYIECMKEYMQKKKKASVIAFLRPSTNIALLALKDLPNKLIVSERGNPERLLCDRYGQTFLKKYYKRANCLVCQTPDSEMFFRKMVPDCQIQIIPNPIAGNIPKVFGGERSHRVVNFCRFSPEKNIPLLIEAFSLFNKIYSEYTLELYGDIDNPAAKHTLLKVKENIIKYDIKDKVKLFAFQDKILDVVRDAAMFVSTSDFEGMSNSMLEAMAIGLPTICTDCPAGGARMIIQNYVNGILVPVGDAYAVSEAMKKVAEDLILAKKISNNGVKLREKLCISKITEEWVNLL